MYARQLLDALGDTPVVLIDEAQRAPDLLPAETPQWDYPLAYGYASVGRAAQVGSAVHDIRPGQLVFAYAPHHTTYCRRTQRQAPGVV